MHASAELCVETLDRQAQVFTEEDWKAQGDEWVKNAIQMSGYSLSMVISLLLPLLVLTVILAFILLLPFHSFLLSPHPPF